MLEERFSQTKENKETLDQDCMDDVNSFIKKFASLSSE